MARLTSAVALLLILQGPLAFGQEEEIADDILVEIDELIVDQTLSKGGRDFYELFYSTWQWPNTAGSFIISIHERPFRLLSTQVQIFVNEQLVFQSLMQPRYDDLITLSQSATGYVRAYISRYEEVLQELEGEDLSGTGIY